MFCSEAGQTYPSLRPVQGSPPREAWDLKEPFSGCKSEARESRGAHPRRHLSSLSKQVWSLSVFPLALL